MKTLVLIVLGCLSFVVSAATLQLQSSAGLNSGTHSITCNFHNKYGGAGHFTSEGDNNPKGAPPGLYGLSAAINEINSDILSDVGVDKINLLKITLICHNQQKVTYTWSENAGDLDVSELLLPGVITIKVPTGCA